MAIYSVLPIWRGPLWLNHDPERCFFLIMAPHTAYLDASGKRHSEVMFVSGFAASEKGWLAYEREWGAHLKKYGIKGPFHTAEYMQGYGEDYAQFRGNNARRVTFEDRAIRIIKENTRKPFSQGLKIPDFNEAARLFQLPRGFRRPYSLCALNAFVAVVRWMRRHQGRGKKRVDPIEFVYEDGDQDKGIFSDAIESMTGQRMSFRKKEECPPFQAADILAWRHARYLKMSFKAAQGKHECFAPLIKHFPHDSCQFFTRDQLMGWCDSLFERR